MTGHQELQKIIERIKWWTEGRSRREWVGASEQKIGCSRTNINEIGVSQNSILRRHNFSIHWCHSANKSAVAVCVCVHRNEYKNKSRDARTDNTHGAWCRACKTACFMLSKTFPKKNRNQVYRSNSTHNKIPPRITPFLIHLIIRKSTRKWQSHENVIEKDKLPMQKIYMSRSLFSKPLYIMYVEHSTSSLSLSSSSASTLCFGCHYIFVIDIYIYVYRTYYICIVHVHMNARNWSSFQFSTCVPMPTLWKLPFEFVNLCWQWHNGILMREMCNVYVRNFLREKGLQR